MRVLLVEDDGLLAFMVEEALENHGYIMVGPAQTLEAAVRLAGLERPDLALVDINLSNGDNGVEVARTLAHRHKVPSVYLTGQEALAKANSAYAVGLIVKPVSPDDLVKAVDKLAGRTHAQPRCLTLFRQDLS